MALSDFDSTVINGHFGPENTPNKFYLNYSENSVFT